MMYMKRLILILLPVCIFAVCDRTSSVDETKEPENEKPWTTQLDKNIIIISSGYQPLLIEREGVDYIQIAKNELLPQLQKVSRCMEAHDEACLLKLVAGASQDKMAFQIKQISSIADHYQVATLQWKIAPYPGEQSIEPLIFHVGLNVWDQKDPESFIRNLTSLKFEKIGIEYKIVYFAEPD